MPLKKTNIKKIIDKLIHDSKKCKSLEDFIDFAYNFRYDEFSIVPLQKKGEIITLLKILQQHKPKNILEIGTAGGGTLFLLSRIADTNATILSIDLPGGAFKGEQFPDWKIPIFQSFANIRQKIHLIREDSHDKNTLKKLKRILGQKKLDFVLVDGDHTLTGVKKDFVMYKSFLRNGGIMAFHDIVEGNKEEVGGVPKFWRKLKSKKQIIEIIDEFGEKCCGIGLIFVNSKKNSSKYLDTITALSEVQNQRIGQLNKKIENLKTEIFTEPISQLMNLYRERIDLQQSFPEAAEGDFIGLINWAKKISSTKSKDELNSKKILSKHSKWFSKFLEKNRKKEADLELEKTNYKKSVDSLQQENFNLSNKIVEYKNNIDERHRERENLLNENEKFKKNVKTILQENANYKKSVDSLQQENTNYKKSVDSLQQENTNYKKSVDSLQQENSNLTNKIVEYKKNIDERHIERENLLNEIEKFKKIVSSMKFQYTETKKELENIKNSVSFKALRSVTSKLDKVREKKQVLKNIGATVSASKKVIENEGVSSFVRHAKQRIKRKELLLYSPAYETTLIHLSSGHKVANNKEEDFVEEKTFAQKFNASVVIPTNADENSLKLLIDKIKSQQGFKTLHIILVNSGNQDLSGIENLVDIKCVNIKPQEFSHGKSRNLGLEKADGDYVIYLSDDAIPASNHLFYDMCDTFSKDEKIAAVTARQIPRSDSDLMSIFSLKEFYEFLELTGDRIISTKDFEALNSYEKRRSSQIDDVCSCYKHEILSKYKFADVQYAEDLEIGIRLVKDGFKIAQLFSTGVIHSHKRPASYYLRRSFVETKVFASLFGNQLNDFKKSGITNGRELFDHILSLYYALNYTIDQLKHKKIHDISDAFDIVNKELPKFYLSNSNANSENQSLAQIFKDFFEGHKAVPNNSFLLKHYLHSLENLKNFLSKTYPNLSGIEDEFFETLYKRFAVIVGNNLGAFVLFAQNENLKDNRLEQIEKILDSGV